jgi:hypothetical protein
MFKHKVAVLSIVSAVLLLAATAFGGIIDPCESDATTDATGVTCVLICPAGDGDQLVDKGATIHVTVNDGAGVGVEGVLASDFYLVDCDPSRNMVLCGGASSSNANAATDANGQTDMTGDIAAGGCAQGLEVIVQGFSIGCPAICLTNIFVKSPDINGDLLVNIQDFSLFGLQYPPNPFTDTCTDYNCDGLVNLQDFSLFGLHYLHQCS